MKRICRLLTSCGLFVSIALLPSHPLQAQPGDVLLSPLDEGFRLLPGTEIQRAASSGSTTAVVWGTSEHDTSGSVVGAYYVQAVRGGAALGSPQRIGVPGMQIPSTVRIAAFDQGFLLLFVNTAAGFHLCTQFFDANSLALGPVIYHAQQLGYLAQYDRMEVVVVGDGARGYRVFFNEASLGATLTGRFDRIGRPIEGFSKWSGFWNEFIRTSAFPDHLLSIDYPRDALPRLVSIASGTVDTIRGGVRINAPFHIGADGQVLVLRDTLLEEYASLRDTNARRRPLPLRQLAASNGYPEPMSLVARDTLGHIVVLTLLVNGGRSDVGPIVRVLRLRMDSIDAPFVLDTLERFAPFADQTGPSGTWEPQWLPGCYNDWELTILFRHNGRQLLHHVRMSGWGDVSQSTESMVQRCGTTPPGNVVRLSDSRRSAVLVDSVILSVPLARDSAPVHVTPALSAVGGDLMCAWTELDTLARHGVRQWTPGSDSIGPVSYHTPKPVSREVAASLHDFPGYATFSSALKPLTSDAVVTFQEEYFAMYDSYEGRDRPPSTHYGMNSRTTIVRPGVGGWRVIDDVEGGTIPLARPDAWRASMFEIDPDDGTIVALLNRGDFREGTLRDQTFVGYSIEGKLWSVTNYYLPFARGVTLPMGGQRLLNIQGMQATLYDTTMALDTFALDANVSAPRYIALYGPYFARTGAVGPDLQIDVFSDRGIRKYSTWIRRPDGSTDYSVVQSGIDSTIAILFGGRNGVRVTLVRFDGTVSFHNVQVSITEDSVTAPVGIFRGDTLAAAWIDMRLGVPRVFGNVRTPVGIQRPVPPSTVPDVIESSEDLSISIAPNPATEYATVRLAGIAAPVHLDIVDMRGIIVASSEHTASDGRIEIGLDGIAPGAYIVLVRAQGRRLAAPLTVW
jgi:hypothetical protein